MADLRPYPGTPRWVTVLGIVALVLILLVSILLFAGVGGPHGPRRHTPSNGPGGHTPPSSVTDDHTRPAVVLTPTHRP